VRDILAMGRAAGRGDGRAAVRARRRAGHPAGAARRGARHLVLRQLPRPAQHRRRAGLRPVLRGQPAGERAVRRRTRHADLKLAAATGPGNKVVLFGSRTGPDGIGGASVLASASFGGAGEDAKRRGAKRPSVPGGRPVHGESCWSSAAWSCTPPTLVVGIQDLGAAGVACATTELAAGGKSGMSVRLDAVPLRDASLGPAEILMSESQERMMAVVRPGDAERFLAICAKWEVPADGDRRGHRHRAAGDDLARRAGRRHPAGQRGRRWARSATGRPGAPRARTRWPPTTPPGCRVRRAGRAAVGPAGRAGVRERGPTRRGSPSSTTVTCAVTPCWPCRTTPG